MMVPEESGEWRVMSGKEVTGEMGASVCAKWAQAIEFRGDRSGDNGESGAGSGAGSSDDESRS